MPVNDIGSYSKSSISSRRASRVSTFKVSKARVFDIRSAQNERLTLLGANSQSSHVHWAVARSSNALFTGREDILRDLETNIRSVVHNGPQQNQCRIVISGMGGQGKSEICLQLAQRVRSLSVFTFWLSCMANY